MGRPYIMPIFRDRLANQPHLWGFGQADTVLIFKRVSAILSNNVGQKVAQI
jgi:hypothetical protein